MALLVPGLAPAPAAPSDLAVNIVDAECPCCVLATFRAPVSRAIAWNVLADYDHVGDFVSSVVSSRAERRPDGRLTVHQVATGQLFLLRRRVEVELEVHEDPGRRIAFQDVLGKDFRAYSGE